MIEIIGTKQTYKDGTALVYAVCDTASELVGVTSIDGVPLHHGSLAITSKEDKLCKFASNGKWYCGNAEVTADV